MSPLSDIDKQCIELGWIDGNFAHAYENQDYEKTIPRINGTNGFYRVGHLLGFFSCYETEEVTGTINGVDCQSEVEHYRAVMDKLGVEL